MLFKEYGELLEVFVADDLDLYCMKLASFRPKDVQDTALLAVSLKNIGITEDDVFANFVRLYGSEYLLRNDDRKMKFMKQQLEAGL